MATKTTITTITGDYGSKDLINANFVALADAIDLLVSRDGESPNTMLANLDMNSNKLINVTDPTNNQDAATKIYVDDRIATGAASAAAAAASAAAALASETAASGYATDADTARGLAVVAQGLAETAQTAAEAAQTAAELALDSFDDRYLGAKASDPTLDNDGDPLLTGALYFNTALNQMKVYSGATWSIVPQIVGIVSNADATAITIDSNENVGVGTATPYFRLCVADSAGGSTRIQVTNTEGEGSGDGLHIVQAGVNSSISNKENGYLSLETNDLERMRIDNSGNVTQNGGVTYLNGGQLIVSRSGNEPYVYFDYSGTEVGEVRGISGGGLRFTTGVSATERMRIDSTGNVGIGTAAPNYRVQLHENSSGANYLQFTNTTTGSTNANGFLIGADSSEHVRIHNYHNSDMIFATNALERMRIGAAGNVGIGTTNPQYPLDIESTTTNGIRITSTDATANEGPYLTLWRNSASPAALDALAAIYFQGEDSVSNATSYARILAYIEDPNNGTEDGALAFSTTRASAMTEAMRISGVGNVGIGTNAPAYALHVSKASAGNYIAGLTNSGTPNPYGLYIYFGGASPDDNTSTFLACNDATTTRCLIYSDGDLANHDGTYGTISDMKFKTDVTPARSQWEDIKALGAIAVNYRMKTDIEQYGDDAHYLLGWIAQDVQKVSPGLVKEAGDPEDPYLVLKQSIIGNKVAIALAEALVRIEQLESTIASLQQQ